MRNSVRGLSLPEILVYMAGFGILMSSVTGVFILAKYYGRASTTEFNINSSAQSVVDRIVRELSESDLSSVTSYSSGAYGFSFLSAYATTGGEALQIDVLSGYPQWQEWVCYFMDGTGNIHRRHGTQSPLPATLTALTATQRVDPFSSPASFPASGDIVVASNATSFGLTTPLPTSSSTPITLSISFAGSVHTNDDYQVQFQDGILCRN